MKRFLVLCVALNLFIAGLIVFSITLGSDFTFPPIPVISVVYCGNTPCWNGIIIGQTSFDEAHQLLLQMGYQFESRYHETESPFTVAFYQPPELNMTCSLKLRFTSDANTAPLFDMILRKCDDVHLGDFILWLGPPNAIRPDLGQSPYFGHHVSFDAYYLLVDIVKTNNPEWLTPFSQIIEICLMSGRYQPSEECLYDIWQGFKPRSFYTPSSQRASC